MPIIIVTGKEIEKIKGDYESYLNGLNMVGEISYSQYSELYDEGTKQIQKAYELGKSELEKENAELKEYNKYLRRQRQGGIKKQYNKVAIIKQQDEHLTKAKEIIEKLKALYFSPVVTKDDVKRQDEILAEAEQFLKE